MNIKKYFIKDKILCLKKHRTLGAWNFQFSSKGGGGGISCSYAFLGICEAGLPGAGFRSSKLKNEIISVKYILIGGSTQKIRPLPLKWLRRSLKTNNYMKSPPPLELNWWFKAP